MKLNANKEKRYNELKAMKILADEQWKNVKKNYLDVKHIEMIGQAMDRCNEVDRLILNEGFRDLLYENN